MDEPSFCQCTNDVLCEPREDKSRLSCYPARRKVERLRLNRKLELMSEDYPGRTWEVVELPPLPPMSACLPRGASQCRHCLTSNNSPIILPAKVSFALRTDSKHRTHLTGGTYIVRSGPNVPSSVVQGTVSASSQGDHNSYWKNRIDLILYSE